MEIFILILLPSLLELRNLRTMVSFPHPFYPLLLSLSFLFCSSSLLVGLSCAFGVLFIVLTQIYSVHALGLKFGLYSDAGYVVYHSKSAIQRYLG